MASKVGTPKGFRDFGPEVVWKRQHILNTIKQVFELHGFMPIETPTLENLSTLTGKYGEEGDKLLFKVLNSGDYLKKANEEALNEKDSRKLTSSISEKGMRYDLTVPLARYVVEHQNDISFPFKRYQMQPVWRADRPQKGRYREFWQCDADIIGSDSLLNEVELLEIYAEVFERLKLPVEIQFNHRGILTDIARYFNVEPNLFATEIDKLDKIGFEKVVQNLFELDNPNSGEFIKKSEAISYFRNMEQDYLAGLKNFVLENSGKLNVENIRAIEFLSKHLDSQIFKLDLFLARGLDYYTGTVMEVKCTDPNINIGSLGGGGRYDNLCEVYGLPNVTGVGISFGLDRIYDVMEELQLWPANAAKTTSLLFVNFDEKLHATILKYANACRAANISTEVYPDTAESNNQRKKQWKYATNKQIRYTAEVLTNGQIMLTDSKGDKTTVAIEALIEKLKDL